jgi:LacI family transcriptional regulator
MLRDGGLKRVIIVVSPTLSIGRECWCGINRFVREHQPAWLLSTHPAWRFADQHQPMALAMPVDGAILWQFTPMTEMRWWKPETKVVATINRELEGTAPTVVADDPSKGRAAALHLLERGVNRFLYLGRPGVLSELRYKGFAAAIRDAGLQTPEMVDFDEHASLEAFCEFLKSRVSGRLSTLGVVAYNDSLGAFVLDCCHLAKIDVPRSIAVVGIDNDDLICESCSPALSSVQSPFERVGYAAAAMLERMLAGQYVPQNHLEIVHGDCYVAARGSSTPGETTDPIIQNAMNIIRSRFRDNISVDDLYRRHEVSRRTFEYRFRKTLGCGPYEMILRVRVENAKELLINTRLKIQAIAFQCGFNSEARLTENFRRLTGFTPGDFRAAGTDRRAR